jgi:hypothetical protein
MSDAQRVSASEADQLDSATTSAQPQAIGRTSATERDAITSEKFAFWLPDTVIVNPFDIVAVEQVNQPGEPPKLMDISFYLFTLYQKKWYIPFRNVAGYLL